MTIFYRGRWIRITHEVFETRYPSYQAYALGGLSHIRVVEQATDPPPVLGTLGTASTGVAGATAVVAGLGWREGWTVFESAPAALAALGLLIASIAVAGACWRTRAVERELVAIYQGRAVRLYRSRNLTTFAQVKRGLVRALERLDDTR